MKNVLCVTFALIAVTSRVTFGSEDAEIPALENQLQFTWSPLPDLPEKVWCDQIHVLTRNGPSFAWKDGGTLNRPIAYGAAVTTIAVKWNDAIMIPGGEVRPWVRTPAVWSVIPEISEPQDGAKPR